MANKVMRWLILGLIMPIIFVACASEKDKYFDRYAKFATHVLQNSETFTSMDWEAAVVQYEELRNEYRYHSSEMTLEERQRIDDWNTKINARIIEQSATDAVETFKGIMNEVVGTINELIEEQ